MTNKENLLAKYFGGTLNEDEKQRFNLYLTEDIEFHREFQFQKSLKRILLSDDQHAAKAKLKAVEAKFKRKQKRFFTMAAASVVVLFALIFGLVTPFKHSNLYADYYILPSNISYPLTRTTGAFDEIRKAFTFYEDRKFADAEKAFLQAYNDTRDSKLLYYRAASLVQIGRLEEAIIVYNNHLRFNDDLASRGRWYLALTYLKAEKQKEAKHILKKICQNDESFKLKEARILLEQLE